MKRLLATLLIALSFASPVYALHGDNISKSLLMPIYGFEDFCYPGGEGCFKNPSAGIALNLGGQSVKANWAAVDKLDVSGASVGIGVDAWTTRAYVNGTAFGRKSLSVKGKDAGDFLCGYLYAKLLKENSCSAFVHVPSHPSLSDLALIKSTLESVRACQAKVTAKHNLFLRHVR